VRELKGIVATLLATVTTPSFQRPYSLDLQKVHEHPFRLACLRNERRSGHSHDTLFSETTIKDYNLLTHDMVTQGKHPSRLACLRKTSMATYFHYPCAHMWGQRSHEAVMQHWCKEAPNVFTLRAIHLMPQGTACSGALGRRLFCTHHLSTAQPS
jgi:hypothetical protein